jgi:hypothetical protein
MIAVSNGIPDHATGFFPQGAVRAQNHNFRWLLNPQQATNATRTPLGPIALAVNGVVFFNESAAMFWNNNRNWEVNALLAEVGIDRCLGHPEQRGTYHYHANSPCLYPDIENQHSPIVGFAWDGFPIYGVRGFTNADGTGGVKVMKSSYRLKQGDRPTPPQGPSGKYDGRYIQDYEFVQGLGDLDQCNGRFGITPEYLQGIYHYHLTVDESGKPAYPYTVPCYKGTPEASNLRGPGR